MQGGGDPFGGFGGPSGSFGGPIGGFGGPSGGFGGPFGGFGGPSGGFRGPFGGPFGGFRGPFGGFGGPSGGFRGPFGGPSGGFGGPFGGFGGQMNLTSSLLGGRDPFDDPFFTRPFEMFESSSFGSNGSPFMNPHASGFLEHQPACGFLEHQPACGFLEHQPACGFLEHQPNRSSGLVIEELNSDDEADEKESGKEKKENPRKHGRSCKEPSVEDPEAEATEKKSKHMPCQNEIYQMHNARPQPQARSFTYQSSTVSYGGANGAYYTSSETRRTGSDGLTFEECKEADSSTREATHRVSRGIHEKGHSVTRKLKSDGHVDTMQTLHNLNEDQLTGFEEAWRGNAQHCLPGLGEGFASQVRSGPGSARHQGPNRGGWALPSTERTDNLGRSMIKPDVGGASRHSGRRPKTDIRSNGAGSSTHANRR